MVEPELPDVPFNRVVVEGGELDYVTEAIRSGHPGSGGTFSARTAQLLAEHVW